MFCRVPSGSWRARRRPVRLRCALALARRHAAAMSLRRGPARLTKLTSSYIVRGRAGIITGSAANEDKGDRLPRAMRAGAKRRSADAATAARASSSPTSPSAVGPRPAGARRVVRRPRRPRHQLVASPAHARARGRAARPALRLRPARFRRAWACRTTRSATWSTAAEAAGLRRASTSPIRSSRAVIAASRRSLARGGGDRRGQHGRLRRRATRRTQHRLLGLCRELPRRRWPARALDAVAASSAPAAAARRSRHALLELGVGDLDDLRSRHARAAGLADASGASASARGRGVRRDAAAAIAPRDGRRQRDADRHGEISRHARSTPSCLRRDQWVADIVYFPAETELLRSAHASRLPHAGRHRHGGLPGREGLRAFHRHRARPRARWPVTSRRRHERE